jgi:hypothetical protein
MTSRLRRSTGRRACGVSVDYGGYEMFAMTPLDTNTGYVRREIYKKRESPDITVVRGSMHDNPTLDKATTRGGRWVDVGHLPAAREFGEFVDVGGLIYPEFERCVVEGAVRAEFIRSLDVVVGIDPGIRNAGSCGSGSTTRTCRVRVR